MGSLMQEPVPELVPAFGRLHAQVASGETLFSAASDLHETDVALGALLAEVESAVTFNDLTPDEEEHARVALEALEGLRGMLASLAVGLEEEDREAAHRDLEAATGQMRVLQGAVAALREAVRQRPPESPVPVVAELLRAGRAVAAGRTGFSALRERLEAIQPLWWEVAGRESVPEDAALHGQALEELARVAVEEDLEALEDALERVRVTGEALVAGEEPTTPDILCPRCGETVGEWDRACPACGGRLPERLPEEAPPTATDLPDYLQTLFEAAEALRTGAGGWDEFLPAVAELRRRAESSLNLLERLPPAPPHAPQDEREAWHAAQEAVENGLERFFQALEYLESLSRRPDPYVLDQGLEEVLAAVEETRGVAIAWRRLVEGRIGPQI